MTPSNLVFLDQNRLLTPKEKNKLRKPMIEKMRRDRMNSSIEQLKQLLEKQLQSQQAGSKLEKADVLETAVGYLKHQSRWQSTGSAPKEREVDFQEGYARCLQEVSRFLLLHKVHPQTQKKLMCHFQHTTPLPASSSSAHWKQPAPPKNLPSLWRPWMESSRG
ncbi:transcription factor HES-5-like [Protobothrops mucrosquamatus]|uniref:transcription factor HES-5-like n=1 Tax=Protobothrops mucrosquamatus TaxID=103944 RepID=UPI000775A782|nr:transcription factor HES-5-like [Protobothrops mucrosquamatus]